MIDDVPLEQSLWAKIAPPAPPTGPVKGSMRAKVAVIGGGFTGSVAALTLAEKGVDVVLLEGREIGWGGSGRNAGLVNAGLFLNPSEIVKHYGETFGPRFVRGLGSAPATVRELIERHRIDCDPGKRGIIRSAHNEHAIEAIAETVRQWKDLGAHIELLDREATRKSLGTDLYPAALVDHRSFTIEPLAYVRGLAAAAIKAGARIHTQSPVTRLEPAGDTLRITTTGGEVTAERVILATGAYDRKLLPGMDRTSVPIGYFMFATDPLSHNLRQAVLPGKAATWDTSPSLLALRYDRDFRLVVGNLGWLPAGRSGQAWARSVLRGMFPAAADLPFTSRWAGTIDLTDDHMPWLAEPVPRVHMVGGFNGRGIGPGTFWGRVLAEWVMGKADADLPIAPGPLPVIGNIWMKQHFFASSWRAYRAMRRIVAKRG